MPTMEKVTAGGKVLALLIRSSVKVDKTEFFSPQDYPLQVGIHRRNEGDEFAPHIHKPVERTIHTTQEMLYVKMGKIRIVFIDEQGNPLKMKILNEGDMILFVEGGHGIKVLEDNTEILEVKQGPYMGTDIDKVKFK